MAEWEWTPTSIPTSNNNVAGECVYLLDNYKVSARTLAKIFSLPRRRITTKSVNKWLESPLDGAFTWLVQYFKYFLSFSQHRKQPRANTSSTTCVDRTLPTSNPWPNPQPCITVYQLNTDCSARDEAQHNHYPRWRISARWYHCTHRDQHLCSSRENATSKDFTVPPK